MSPAIPSKMKLGIVLGTRPEIIKMAPVVRECQRRRMDFFVLHTGQHYSYSMDKVFFNDLELPGAEHNLEVGSGTHGVQTGKILSGTEKVFMDERPNVVLVQGDTNTVMAAALSATKLGIKVGHVEAGLRSFDRSMPEEINRIIADHISDYLFAPTEASRRYLADEGITNGVFVTGNTIVDAVFQAKDIAARRSNVLNDLGLRPKDYILATAHRAENVDNRTRLEGMIEGMRKAGDELGMEVLFPMHPRTVGRVKEFDLSLDGIRVIEPVGFLDFLSLESNAGLILSDSGGVQEEACILGIPCVTLRDNTERPETIEVGANMLAGAEPQKILSAAKAMAGRQGWENPFGDGAASRQILDAII
jgi:UDP-N-acetylglucosamine 2-epimerase (non-hydrolysing)